MTSSPTLTAEQQAHLNVAAAQALGLRQVDVETINARTITYDEVERLALAGDFKFDAYIADEVGFLVPVEVHVTPKRRYADEEVPHHEVHLPMEKKRGGGVEMVDDPHNTCGYKIEAEAKSVLGNTHGLILYTSARAEESDRILRHNDHAGEDGRRLFLRDPEAKPQPLMPIFGSQATISFIAEGIDADVLADRVRRVLAEEFGDTLRENMKVRTRPVENRRVDVYTYVDRTPVALNILPAEVSMVMEGHGPVQTEPHKIVNGLIIGA